MSVTFTPALYLFFLTCGERMLKFFLAEISPVSWLIESHFSGSSVISNLIIKYEEIKSNKFMALKKVDPGKHREANIRNQISLT